MTEDAGDPPPFVVRFAPADGRPAVELERTEVFRAGLRATFGHAARLTAGGERGAVELVEAVSTLGAVVV